mmetsp:Transcript_102425/g.142660  ORF Transcript_102425/g.142660 Transcript_102425/m.142660 type:complete len:243 (+) Transcript_102425:313-1041(+)
MSLLRCISAQPHDAAGWKISEMAQFVHLLSYALVLHPAGWLLGAGVAEVVAAPDLLGMGPACLPVGDTSQAVEGQVPVRADLHPMSASASGGAPAPHHAAARSGRGMRVVVKATTVVDDVVDDDAASCHSSSGTSGGSALNFAAGVLVGAAPALLARRPAGAPVGHAGVAVVRQAGVAVAVHGRPRPVAVHLDVLPDHAIPGIDRRRVMALAALSLLGAAPVLLLRGPSPEEVVDGRIAVEG